VQVEPTAHYYKCLHQTPAFPPCFAPNCSLNKSSFQQTPETQRAVPKTPVKETLALDQFTQAHTPSRVPSGPLPGTIWEVHMQTSSTNIFSFSPTSWPSSFSQAQVVKQAVNWSPLLKQSQDKGSLSETTLQHLYEVSREHESINRRISYFEMLVNSPRQAHSHKVHTQTNVKQQLGYRGQ